jgi:hypothetical protein
VQVFRLLLPQKAKVVFQSLVREQRLCNTSSDSDAGGRAEHFQSLMRDQRLYNVEYCFPLFCSQKPFNRWSANRPVEVLILNEVELFRLLLSIAGAREGRGS